MQQQLRQSFAPNSAFQQRLKYKLRCLLTSFHASNAPLAQNAQSSKQSDLPLTPHQLCRRLAVEQLVSKAIGFGRSDQAVLYGQAHGSPRNNPIALILAAPVYNIMYGMSFGQLAAADQQPPQFQVHQPLPVSVSIDPGLKQCRLWQTLFQPSHIQVSGIMAIKCHARFLQIMLGLWIEHQMPEPDTRFQGQVW